MNKHGIANDITAFKYEMLSNARMQVLVCLACMFLTAIG